MLVLNVSSREVDWLKDELEGCRDMALDRLNDAAEDAVEKVVRNDEVKTLEHIIGEGLDNSWVRRGELVERILGQVWDLYLEFNCLNDDLEEIAEDMDMSVEEFEEIFNGLGYTRD